MELPHFYNDMYTSGLSANTVKHYHANIHKALKYAVKINLISVNESEKTELPKMERYEAMFYNEQELGMLFNAFRGDRMEIVVLIAAYYGLRRSEIIGLRWDAMKEIQVWLGHSTFQVTADFYSHLEYNSKVNSANAIANALGTGSVSNKAKADTSPGQTDSK